MSKMKNYMMGIEDEVFGIPNLEEKIGESEHIEEVETFVVEELGLKTSFDIGIAKGVVAECWNEVHSNYM